MAISVIELCRAYGEVTAVAKQPIDVPSRGGAYWLLLVPVALVLALGVFLAATGRGSG